MNTVIKPYSTYRDRGWSWINKVPAHWEVRRLRNVADMRVSSIDKHVKEEEEPVRLCNYVDVYKNNYIDNQMNFMAGTATAKEIERFRLEEGDVLITKDSESWNDIGVPALVIESASDLVSGYHLALLRPRKESVLGNFLFRALQSNCVARQFHVSARGVTRYGLAHADIKSICLPIPPLSEQASITRFLDYVGSNVELYIDAKEQLIDLLDEKKQAIIDRAITRGLNPSATLRPTDIGWMPEVPAHWEVRRLRNVADMRISNVDKHVKEEEKHVRLCNYVDVYKNECIDGQINFMAGTATANEIERFRLEEGDVLITKDSESWDDIGVPALVIESASDLVSGYHLALLRPRKEAILGNFLFRAIQSNCIAYQFHVSAKGVTRYGLAHADIKSIWVPVPPLSEQRAISDYLNTSVSNIHVAIDYAQCQIKLVREYYERLTNDVVTGKLDVREFQVDFAMNNENQNSRLSQLLADFDARGVGLNMADNLSREALYRRNASS